MTTVFEAILRMSIDASVLLLLVLILRRPVRRYAPVWAGILWLPVLYRLLCSVGVPLPSDAASPADLVLASLQGFNLVGQVQEFAEETVVCETPSLKLLPLLAGIWLGGAFVAAVLQLRRYLGLRQLLRAARQVDGRLYISKDIPVPFVLGSLRPRIYLPEGLNQEQTAVILLHERMHVRRGDGLMRLAFCAARILHWFNPLVYLADRLCRQDTEIACDASALRNASMEDRAEYARCLLDFARPNGRAAGLGFLGGSTRQRITEILRGRKKIGVRTVLCMGACLLLAACSAITPNHAGFGPIDQVALALTDSIERTYASDIAPYLDEYEKFGITLENGLLYYRGQRINQFIDGYVTESENGTRSVVARFAVSNLGGEVDVYTERAEKAPVDGEPLQYGPIRDVVVRAAADQITAATEDGAYGGISWAADVAAQQELTEAGDRWALTSTAVQASSD